MGYTHYWHSDNGKKPNEEIISKITSTLEHLYSHKNELFDSPPCDLAEEYISPNNHPIFNSEEIRFNGLSERGHETFLIDWNNLSDFDFCKTNQKPYDFWVVSALLIIKSEAPEILDISSDGDKEEWDPIKEKLVNALAKANIELNNLNTNTEIEFSEDGKIQLKSSALEDEITFNSFF